MTGRPIEVLLIEDNSADVDLIKEAIQAHKLSVNIHNVSTGEKGLDYLKRAGSFAGSKSIDLILLDLNLPGMSGREVLSEIKRHPELKVIPTIIVTSSEADLDILQTYELGANSYVVKPVDFDRFTSLVNIIEDFWLTIARLPTMELRAQYSKPSKPIQPENQITDIDHLQEIQVLMIEDNDPDADLIIELLDQSHMPHFRVHRAETLSQGKKILNVQHVDIVILDLSLPDSMDIQTIEEVLTTAPYVPIVVLTGYEDKTFELRTIRFGAQDYLYKGKIEQPVLVRSLLYAIERKRIELELSRSLIRESEAKEVAEKAVGIRDEFLAIASHELRTPLTSLKMQMELLTRFLVTEKWDKSHLNRLFKLTENANQQVDRFARLVNTLLDISKIQSGRLKLDLSEFDLNQMISETIQRLSDELKKAGIEPTMNFSGALIGEWDKLRLEQVIINLITNVIKYSRSKSVNVSTELTHKNRVYIKVKDQGVGIAPDNVERIFQRFERAVSGRDKTISGLGLGLYIVRQIINAHGGTIQVESELGQGSTFVIDIPLKVSLRLPES
jgi:signal transduction histidine kinase